MEEKEERKKSPPLTFSPDCQQVRTISWDNWKYLRVYCALGDNTQFVNFLTFVNWSGGI